MTAAPAAPGSTLPVPTYGDRIAAVEPGGVERVPLSERHGSPTQLVWTWSSPNLEFATVFVGVIAILYFGLSFWQAVIALLLGNLLGSITHGVLSSWGPKIGLPQMIVSRSAFGFIGNFLPAGLNTVIAGVGWFAVNSVSGALALAALTDASPKFTLVIIVLAEIAVAFFGHNLVHAFERFAFPLLVLVFALGAIAVLSKAHPSFGATPGNGGFAGFTLAFSAAFGYAAGWNPYATDYTRYLPEDSNPRKVGLMAGLGMFGSCSFLMIVGAASVTVGAADTGNVTSNFTSIMPGWVGNLVLLGIALGAVSANALNVYSGAMSFLALGIKLPLQARRAAVAIFFGAIGLVLAWYGLDDAGANYEAFLLVIAYWIAPWLGVVLVDRYLRRGTLIDDIIVDTRYTNWSGPIAMGVGMIVSIGLFCNQPKYTGPLAKNFAIGDLTPIVGFALAAVLYYALFMVFKPERPTAHHEVEHIAPA